MFKQNLKSIAVWQYDLFSKYSNILHYVTGREGGKSQSPFNALNLSYQVGDREKDVEANREILASNLGISTRQIIFPEQTHGNQIEIITKPDERLNLASTDGLITDQPGIAIGVLAADCAPLILFDPVKKVIAAVHAGWRGTVAQIPAKAISIMQNEFGTAPENIKAGIGPSISQDAYEVGSEVIQQMEKNFILTQEMLQYNNNGEKACLNLWETNKRLLLNSGVPENAIEIAGICTYQEHQTFFSARRSKGNTGRFCAGIMIKS